jgi:hypothetical protein
LEVELEVELNVEVTPVELEVELNVEVTPVKRYQAHGTGAPRAAPAPTKHV